MADIIKKRNPISKSHSKRGSSGSGRHKNDPLDEKKGRKRKSKFKKEEENEARD